MAAKVGFLGGQLKEIDSEMAGPSGVKLGGLVEGMCPKVRHKEIFRSVKVACQNGRQSGQQIDSEMAGPIDSEMAGPSGLKLGGLVEGMCPNVRPKEFFRSVKGAWQNGRQSGQQIDSEMAGSSELKLGGLVEGMCPNVLMKEFFRSVNGRGKMAAKRQDFSTCDNCEPWGYVALVG